MLTAILVSLPGIICFALSQQKHYRTLLSRPSANGRSTLLRIAGVVLLLAVQPVLWSQAQVGLSYVIWLCWISIWIVLTGLMLSFFSKR